MAIIVPRGDASYRVIVNGNGPPLKTATRITPVIVRASTTRPSRMMPVSPKLTFNFTSGRLFVLPLTEPASCRSVY